VKVARCGWAKLNVLQMRWLVCRLAALLILRRVGIMSVGFSTVVDGLQCRHSLAGNVWRLLAVGLSKHQLSITSNVYMKIQMFISEGK